MSCVSVLDSKSKLFPFGGLPFTKDTPCHQSRLWYSWTEYQGAVRGRGFTDRGAADLRVAFCRCSPDGHKGPERQYSDSSARVIY